MKYKSGMKCIKIFALAILVYLSGMSGVFAKKNDFGVWLDMSATKKIHAATLGLIGQIYTKDNSSTLDRLAFGLKGDYTIYPWLSAGAGNVFINFFRAGYQEFANRFYVQVVPSWHLNKFCFSFREMYQETLYPETRTNALTSRYWRNRFEVSFNESAWKFEPLVDLESLYHFGKNSPNPNPGYRIIVGTNYSPTKNQKYKIYGMLTDGTIVCQYIFGVSYEFKF
jgi:hypothetical protein